MNGYSELYVELEDMCVQVTPEDDVLIDTVDPYAKFQMPATVFLAVAAFVKKQIDANRIVRVESHARFPITDKNSGK